MATGTKRTAVVEFAHSVILSSGRDACTPVVENVMNLFRSSTAIV